MASEDTQPDPAPIPVSVRTLVGFVLGGGDLGFEFGGARRALEGIRLHQQLQRSRPPEYRPEVTVAKTVAVSGLLLRVNGRMDGLYEIPGRPVVEEIKTTTRDVGAIAPAAVPEHWGQARVYAYLYADAQGVSEIDVHLTYIHVDTRDVRTFRESWRLEDLAGMFDDLVTRYARWARRLDAWSQIRDAAITQLDFPFPRFRPGQRNMAAAVYRTLMAGRQEMIQAATGIGKTMGVLFGAIKSLPELPPTALFYLTARTTGQRAAREALQRLTDKGLRIKAVFLTAKDKICFLPDATCQADACPYAAGYFDRLPEGRDVFFENDIIDREIIEAAARDHELCPFEFSLELAAMADCIVCDYNYAFDPRVSLKGVLQEEQRQAVLLVDEAHNLVDRARDMFSADLTKRVFLDVRRPLRKTQPHLYKQMGRINAWMLKTIKALDPGPEGAAQPTAPETLYPLLRRFCAVSEKLLASAAADAALEALLALYFQALAFLRVGDTYASDYMTCYRAEEKDLHVKLFCLDPARQLAGVLSRCRAAVFFSATLSPAVYFQRLLGVSPETQLTALPSPFPEARLAVVRARHISTLYKERSATEAVLCDLLAAVIAARRGNYLFFFPSYVYMKAVFDRFTAAPRDGYAVFIQTPEMTDAERQTFIARFEAGPDSPVVGFAVMGGIFGEGIDLMGDRLSGAVIVGVGLPGISMEQDLIRDYFQEKEGRGFAFAYRYPGMNRVLQAAGRVIRSESDRGVVVLVDQRYGTAAYADLLPGAWRRRSVRDTDALQRSLSGFWEGGAPC
jgi:DNA excision repair protein ERCC-2